MANAARTPLEMQLLTLLSLFHISLKWQYWRQLLLDGFCAPDTTAQKLDAVLHKLQVDRLIRLDYGGGISTWMDSRERRLFRRGAAKAFGPIGFDVFLKVSHDAKWFSASIAGMEHLAKEKYLEYLADLEPSDELVRVMDEIANGGSDLRDFYDRNFNGSQELGDGPFPDGYAELFVPARVERALMTGDVFGGELDGFVGAAERHAALRIRPIASRIAPLFVWSGRADLLNRYVALLGNAGGDCLQIPLGFLGAGWRKMPTGAAMVFNDAPLGTKLLLALLAEKFPDKALRLRDNILRWARNEGDALAQAVLFRISGMALKRIANLPGMYSSPPFMLADTMAHALSGKGDERVEYPQAKVALDAARKAMGNGWTYLAAQLSSLLVQYRTVSDAAADMAALAPADIPLLWVRDRPANPWDAVIEMLGETVRPILKASASRRGGEDGGKAVLSAKMTVCEFGNASGGGSRAGGGMARLLHLSLNISRRLKRGGLTAFKTCTWQALKSSLDANALEISHGQAEALKRWAARTQDPGYHDRKGIQVVHGEASALLDILLDGGSDIALSVEVQGKAAALRYDFDYGGRTCGGGEARTIDNPRFEVVDLALDVQNAPGGGLSLSLPELAWEGANDLLFKLDGDHITWFRIPEKLVPFFAFFHKTLPPGKRTLVIEGGGAEKAKELLAAAACAGVPMAGAIGGGHDGGTLPRASGGNGLVFRLDRRDGALHAALFARPLAELPGIILTPGRGWREKPVSGSDGMLLLARDLDGEVAAAEKAGAALSDFEGEAEGDFGWILDTPERELAFLETLHGFASSADGAVEVEWKAPPRERTALRTVASSKLEGSKDAQWWFSVEGEFVLDDGTKVALRELVEALPLSVGGYVPLGERTWVRLAGELRRRIEALAAAGAVRGSGLRVSRAALPLLGEAFGDGAQDGGAGENPPRDAGAAPALPEAMKVGAQAICRALATEHNVPEGLAARLRPYQNDGYSWLAKLADCGIGSCLADDMGLGKTVQLLALLLERSAGGASLVVAPAGVCANWVAEAARFAPGLRTILAAETAELPADLGPGDIVVASYGIAAARAEQFGAPEWNGIVLDEAQAIKNPATRRAEAVKTFRSKWRCAATGTPVENRLSDLWSIFDFLNPGLLGTLPGFRARFVMRDGRPTALLRSLVRPLILRRLKGEVLDELPPKTEINLPVELGDEERAAYEALREQALAEVVGNRDGGRMRILAALTRLRRYCCSPSLVFAGGRTGAKLEALEELLGNLRENGHRALVFSQFTDVLALVRPILGRNGWAYEYLDGSTPQVERQKRVEEFQRGTAPFFLISLKAGGTGLNLTAANYVVLLDPWWNPAVEDQAANRAHRIGQSNPVTVYRLVAADTVEEKVIQLHGQKRSISEAVLDGASDATLSEDELVALLR